MHICFFLGGFYGNGGIGRVTSVLAGRLAGEADFTVTALSYVRRGEQRLYPLSERVREAFFLERYESMAQLMLTGGERRLRRFLKENGVDVLIACGALFFPISVRAARGTRTKVVCWEHSDPEGNHDHRAQNAARVYGAKRADQNVVLTDRALRVYREKLCAAPTVRIYNPVADEALRRAGGYDAASRRIVSVGRLTYQKHFAAAVDVAARVLPRHPDWSWDVFGAGEERETLETLVRERGLSGRMTFCGQVNDLYDRYQNYGVMVMTSRYEGFPMTLLEGLANGLPLLAFDVPTGPDEIIADGGNGFLVPAGDAAAMAERLDALLSDDALRLRLSAGAKHACERFTEQTAVNEWAALLRTI